MCIDFILLPQESSFFLKLTNKGGWFNVFIGCPFKGIVTENGRYSRKDGWMVKNFVK